MTLTLGADPEIFLIEQETGHFVSASDFDLPGTKEEPFAVPHGAVQVDGTAVEFNIDPTDNLDEWERNLSSVMQSLHDLLPKGITFSNKSMARFNPTYFKQLPFEATRMGCSPDENVYWRTRPAPISNTPARFAGGHVHISGFSGLYTNLVEALDGPVGVGMLQFGPLGPRKATYGAPGTYRTKPYGVEYRTPSNAWIFSKERRAWMFNTVQEAARNPTYHWESALAEAFKAKELTPAMMEKFRVRQA